MKLELKDIRKSFGEKEILHGVRLRGGERTGTRAAWSKWRRQDDDDPDYHGCIPCEFR